MTNNKNIYWQDALISRLDREKQHQHKSVVLWFTFFVGGDSGAVASSVYPGLNGLAAQGAAGGNNINIRQAYMTVGDASWGSVKFGRDLGIYGSDAILSDMTLLGVGVGVGVGSGGNGSSTLGRIGSGYMYADWVGQISYASPNWNGFQVTAGVREPWGNNSNSDLGFQAKATYDFAANDVTGRVWVGGLTQDIQSNGNKATSEAWEIGAKASYAGAQLVGYYYDGKNLGSPEMVIAGITPASGLGFGQSGDTSGGYVQATYVIPGVGTKVGASWGQTMDFPHYGRHRYSLIKHSGGNDGK